MVTVRLGVGFRWGASLTERLMTWWTVSSAVTHDGKKNVTLRLARCANKCNASVRVGSKI